MKRTNHLPLSQYENKLETIQEEYLQKHFQQIAIVLSKYYHYAFQIIKSLWKLQPNKRQNAVRVIEKIIRQIIERRKRFIFGSIVRRQHERKYLKSKSCIFITTFIQRKLVGVSVFFFRSIKQDFDIKPSVSKEKHLFLLITLSNLNKLLSFTKSQGFYAIKHQSFARKQQTKKIKLMKLVYTLNNYSKRLIADSFLAISHYDSQGINTQESEDSVDESILIESYKIMASNLTINNFANTKTSLQQLKIQASIFLLARILKRKQQNLIRWSFMDIYCFQNHRFKYQTIQVLKRQIVIIAIKQTILQQQYQQI